jgi:hypothetical protein
MLNSRNFDKDCKGKKGNPEAIALLSMKAQKQAAERFVNDLKTVAESCERSSGALPGIPPDVARKDFGQEKAPTLPILFRDACSAYSLLSAPPPKERATRPPPSSPLPFPRVMPLEPLRGGFFHDLGRRLVQADSRLLDSPNDVGIHGRQELLFVALRGFSPLS